MNPYLAKLTTEQERAGGSNGNKKWGGRVPVHPDPDHTYDDQFGGFHAHGRRRNYDHKELTDVLNPLRGTLRANLGRLWDDVFSEFCSVLDQRSMQGYHIWTHLMQMVDLDLVRGADGKLYEHSDVLHGLRLYRGGGYREKFYVDPDTGILCQSQSGFNAWKYFYVRNKAFKVEVPGQERQVVPISEPVATWIGKRVGSRSLHRYERVNGTWFEIKEERQFSERFIPERDRYNFSDAFYQKLGYVQTKDGVWGLFEKIELEPRVVLRRTCNRKEIKRILQGKTRPRTRPPFKGRQLKRA